MRIHLQTLPLCLCACIATGQVFALDLSRKIRLTDLGPGVKPTAINDNGQIAGQNANGKAFRWENGVFTTLGTLGGNESYANDINNSGVVVGWSYDAGQKMKAFRWGDDLGVMENLDSSVALEGAAEAINSHGDIVGWRTNGIFVRSTGWGTTDSNGGFLFQEIDHKAFGINNDRVIVGAIYENGRPKEGYYWDGRRTPATFSGVIGDSYFPYAGVSNKNLSAGEQTRVADYLAIGEPFSLNIGRISQDDLFSVANGLNDLDLIVGESDQKGFVFDQNMGELFDINGFAQVGVSFDAIIRLLDINNDNTFVGVGLIGAVEHGLYGEFVVPEPDPSSLLMIGIVFAIAGFRGSSEERIQLDNLLSDADQ